MTCTHSLSPSPATPHHGPCCCQRWIGRVRQGCENDSQSRLVVAELAAESLPEVCAVWRWPRTCMMGIRMNQFEYQRFIESMTLVNSEYVKGLDES